MRAAYKRAAFVRRSSISSDSHLDINVSSVGLLGTGLHFFQFTVKSDGVHGLQIHPMWSVRIRNPHLFGPRTIVLAREERKNAATLYEVLVAGRGSTLKVLTGTMGRDKRGNPKFLRCK